MSHGTVASVSPAFSRLETRNNKDQDGYKFGKKAEDDSNGEISSDGIQGGLLCVFRNKPVGDSNTDERESQQNRPQ